MTSKKWNLCGLRYRDNRSSSFLIQRNCSASAPQGGHSRIVWVFYWPFLLGGRIGSCPAHCLEPFSPHLFPAQRAVKPGRGIASTPPTGPRELCERCSIGWRFLASSLFYLSLLFLQVRSLNCRAHWTLLTRWLAGGNSLSSQTKKWGKNLISY